MAREVYRRFDGEALRRSRLSAGLTLSELGQSVGVGSVAVRHWEAGISSPSTQRLPKVAEALGLEVEDLYEAPDRKASLADLRRAAGLTQAQLAEKLGTYKTMVSDWERGKSEVPIELMGVYTEALGTTIVEVYDASSTSAGVSAGFTREQVRVESRVVDGEAHFFAASPDALFEAQVNHAGKLVDFQIRTVGLDAETMSRAVTLVMQEAVLAAASAREGLNPLVLDGERPTAEQSRTTKMREAYEGRRKARELLAMDPGLSSRPEGSDNQ